ncbi:hypothetical protein [Bradyrhizobium sp. SEMIA]|uniref:hypothetical protein n=1 Tax=Bradyrhizobium sp. SEMIA TaxID=2597515 RepID=UPI0018A3770B|nr:hypothetical protein [Bradyrhizobium sp. SEMIA]QOG22044.1 hypothetical protein FOM02_36905 [Bradyrhizobium sp. SEMIA]
MNFSASQCLSFIVLDVVIKGAKNNECTSFGAECIQDRILMPLSRILSVVIVATGLLLSVDAFAGDYTISYAFDGTTTADVARGATGASNQEGVAKECQYERRCTIELTKSDLTISLNVERSGSHKVIVFANGGRSRSAGCCYFSGGDRLAARELTEPLLRLWIYEGQARKRNEYVENIPLGLLYLQFSDLK